jgi:hypothetical protein
MQAQPSVIATGDFLYFAPAGQAYTIPAAGIVAATAIPDPTDPIWTTWALGTVKKPTQDKVTSKEIKTTAPLPGSGTISLRNIIRPEHELSMEVEMNEISRLAIGGFYKAGLIATNATSFTPLSTSAGFQGWLKRQRYDASQANGTPWIVDDWWVDLNCTDITNSDPNLITPKFLFTWLYSALQGSNI